MVGKGFSVLFEKGIYEGNYLVEWLDGSSRRSARARSATCASTIPHSSLPPEKRYKLVVMTSDVTRGELVRLPWDYPRYGLEADDQLVADAVRASMSIPFFYEPLRFTGRDDAGKTVQSYMVDGGMLSNFPIEVFDRTDGKPPRWPTFGIKLSARPTAPVLQRFEVKGAFGLARAMVGTMTNFHDQMHIDDPAVLARTMFVDTGQVKATDFDIDEPTQDMLFANGQAGGDEFLTGWDFDTYVKEFRSGDTVDLTDARADGRRRLRRGGDRSSPAVRSRVPAQHVRLPLPQRFPHVPVRHIGIPGVVSLPIGDASNGLCGGMAFAARDYFEAERPPPDDTDAPGAGPLFDYLVDRLFDSFDLPLGSRSVPGADEPAALRRRDHLEPHRAGSLTDVRGRPCATSGPRSARTSMPAIRRRWASSR